MTEQAWQMVEPVAITNENFARWGQVIRLPDADPSAVQVNQGKKAMTPAFSVTCWISTQVTTRRYIFDRDLC